MNQALEELRKRIDSIDDDLVKLLVERLEVSGRIGRLKAAGGLAVTDAQRERAVLERAASGKPGLSSGELQRFFSVLFDLSKNRQGDLSRSEREVVDYESESIRALAKQGVVVWGVGLIGGSIARAVSFNLPECPLVGIESDPDSRALMHNEGIFSSILEEPDPSVLSNGLVVLCMPVDRNIAALERLEELAGGGSVAAAITDVGSTKVRICDCAAGLSIGGRFLGSHPIAGTENSGYFHSSRGLLNRRYCIVEDPGGRVVGSDVSGKVAAFWSVAGMKAAEMGAGSHDSLFSAISHLPHIVAFALMTAVSDHEEALRFFKAAGFNDFTRIASSDPEMWSAVFSENSDKVLGDVAGFIKELSSLAEKIKTGDEAAVKAYISVSRSIRGRILEG